MSSAAVLEALRNQLAEEDAEAAAQPFRYGDRVRFIGHADLYFVSRVSGEWVEIKRALASGTRAKINGRTVKVTARQIEKG